MNVVVTGAAGFLGSHLCEALLAVWPEARVLGIGREAVGPAGAEPFDRGARFKYARTDIRYISVGGSLYNSIEAADVVFHLAAETGTRAAVDRGFELAQNNREITAAVLRIASRARVVLASTAEVYGDHALMRAETDPIVLPAGNASAYALGKAFDEAAVRDRGGRVCRLFNPTGARQQPQAAVAAFVRSAVRERKIVLDGAGDQVRSFIHVRDAVAGMIAVAEKGVPGEIYNVGVDRPVSMRDLAFLVARNVHEDCEVVTRFAHSDVVGARCRRPDARKLETLGWAAQHTLEEAILDIAAEVRAEVRSEVEAG